MSKTAQADPMAAWGTQFGSAVPSMAEALLGRIDSAPTLAPLWDFDRKTAAASAAWWRLQQAQLKYRALLDGVWPAVQKAAAQRHAQAAKQKKTINAREAVERWLEALNQELLALMRTPAYLSAQRETLDAALSFRETMATIAAEACEWLQLPAREEVDDLARSLTELRREVRALQRHKAGGQDDATTRRRAARKTVNRAGVRT